jgi:large subunit ribosomal protein L6
MSRVGKYPVIVPEGVNITVEAENILVKGKNGELSCHYSPDHVLVSVDGNKVVVAPKGETKLDRALWGTTRANINTLVKGVSEGFTKELELIGVGYKARVEGTKLILSLGYSHDVTIDTPKGLKITCASPTQISIFGADKQLVGQTASEIREWRKPEPYKGKGIRYVGEYVRRKEGKKK